MKDLGLKTIAVVEAYVASTAETSNVPFYATIHIVQGYKTCPFAIVFRGQRS